MRCAPAARVRSRLPGVRPRAARVRILGWRERGRAACRRVPPDRADRRTRPLRQLTRCPTRRSTSASSAAPTSISSPRPSRLPTPGETVLGHRPMPNIPAARDSTRRCPPLGREPRPRSSGRSARRPRLDASAACSTPNESMPPRSSRSTGPTGRALIIVDNAGENSIVVIPGANAMVRAAPLEVTARVVLAQLEIPVDTVEAMLAQRPTAGATIVLNPAPAAELPSTLIATCDVIVAERARGRSLGGAGRTPRRRLWGGRDDARRCRRRHRDPRRSSSPEGVRRRGRRHDRGR